MANAITTPSLQINGNYIPIVPNSLTYTRGVGTVTVESQSIGGTVETVYKKDQTKAVGQLTFIVEPIDTNINFIRSFQDSSPDNVVQFTEEGFTRTMSTAAITNDPTIELGSDKNITVEMAGDPVT